LVSGSAGSIKDNLDKPKPDDKPISTGLISQSGGIGDSILDTAHTPNLTGGSTSTAFDSPAMGRITDPLNNVVKPIMPKTTDINKDKLTNQISSLINEPNTGLGMKAKSIALETKPEDKLNYGFSLMGNDTAQLKQGGKNPKQATPVEAEGGEVEVTWDDGYNITNTKPIVGPSHAEGGVDVKLPKNHAILNKEQQGRLKGGEGLKSILDSLPNVNNAEKAQAGVEDDDPP